MTGDEKQKLVERFFSTPEGRRKLAASMVVPKRLRRPCVVCEDLFHDLQEHAASMGDPEHQVMEVMIR